MRIVQYWRLCQNTKSAKIAGSLGFTENPCYQLLRLSQMPFSLRPGGEQGMDLWDSPHHYHVIVRA